MTNAPTSTAKNPAKMSRKRSAAMEVQDALLKLAPTREGFEGLTASLIDAATGGAIKLFASGDQLGVDGVAEPVGTGPRRAMQSKRYYPATALSRTALLGEMAAAHAAWPGIDCWILPSTRPLLGVAAKSVRELAEQHGWGFIALDWSNLQPGLPRLGTLCAAYIDIACEHAPLKKVRAALEALAKMPGFPTARDTLLAELNATDIGFAGGRTAARAELQRIFEDPQMALAIAGPSPALLAQAPPVGRAGLRAAITDWWTSPVQAALLVGNEGMGKTWSALDAARDLAGLPDGPIPVVIGSANAGQAADGYAALITALRRIGEGTKLRVANPDLFWQRRMALWTEKGSGTQPKLLVLIDGLDELDTVDWSAWLAPLRIAARKGLIRLLLTCRPDEWQNRTSLNTDATLTALTVEHFTPEERDAYLVSRGIADPDKLAVAVRKAALHPRTAFHLTRMAAELGDLTRITREQLLLRDFHNLCQIKGGPINADVFEHVVREMAEKAQTAALAQKAFTITSGAVLDVAADASGDPRDRMRRVLSDLISGNWLERDVDNATRIGFSDQSLPDAVGLALADMIRKQGTKVALDEIDRFLEPWGADDLVEKVLRTCSTALVIDPKVPDALCHAVLARWRQKPSHDSGGQDFWRRLHIFRPAVFLDLCAKYAQRSDWLCEWGVACFWEDHPAARIQIEARLHDWLTVVPVPGIQTSSNPKHQEFLNRDRRRQLRRLAKLEKNSPGAWQHRIGREAGDLPGRISLSAARILGFLPRLPFVEIVRDWAINCAAAGWKAHAREVEALMRDLDAVDGEAAIAALRDFSNVLEKAGDKLALSAAAHLLRLGGDPADAARADALLPLPALRVSPCGIKRIDTAEGPRLARDRQIDLNPIQLIAAVGGEAGNPVVELDAELSRELDAAAASLAPKDVPSLYKQDGLRASVMFRWRADRHLELLRAYLLMEPIPVEEHDLADFQRIAMGAMPFLEADERHALAARLDAAATSEGTGRAAATALRLGCLPLADQTALLLSRPTSEWPRDYRHLLSDPVASEREKVIAEIDFAAPAPALQASLHLALTMLERFGPVIVERDWTAGFTHPDPDIQYKATRLAQLGGGSHAVQQFEPLGLSARDLKHASLAFETSALISELDDEALPSRLGRLDAETLAHVYLHRPALRDAVLPLWRSWMQEKLAVAHTSWSFGGARTEWCDRAEAYAAYAANHRAEVTALLQGAWDNKETRSNILNDRGEGPAWLLLAAIAGFEPGLVKTIWRSTGRRGVWSGYEESFPAQLPAGEIFDDLRSEMLERPRTDERLFDAVYTLEYDGHTDFLVNWIKAQLDKPSPATRARAITVAGFLDASEKAIALWEGVLAAPPAAGWLRDVHHAASIWFESARRSRHWNLAMCQAEGEEAALRAFQLRNLEVDARSGLFFHKESYRIPEKSWRAQWLDFFSKAAAKLHASKGKGLKDSYLHSERTHMILNHY